jgi:hypothetical protein
MKLPLFHYTGIQSLVLEAQEPPFDLTAKKSVILRKHTVPVRPNLLTDLFVGEEVGAV